MPKKQSDRPCCGLVRWLLDTAEGFVFTGNGNMTVRGRGMNMNMFHRQATALAVLLCAVSFLLSGCGGEKAVPSEGTNEKRIVKDIKGNEVEVPRELRRIAVVPLPWASVVDVLDGGSERMVAIHPGAMSAYRGHFLSTKDSHFGTLDTQLIGQDFSVHVEGMLEKGIEAVILWSYQDEVAAKLKQVGIAPVMINNANVGELQKSFLIVGQLLGKEARAEKVVDFYQKTMRTSRRAAAPSKRRRSRKFSSFAHKSCACRATIISCGKPSRWRGATIPPLHRHSRIIKSRTFPWRIF